MGRKSLVKKERKSKSDKTQAWANILLPKLQDVTLKNLTMDDFAALIGKSKSTIYEYFKTKEEILHYMVQLHLQELSQYRTILQVETANFIEAFEVFILFLGSGISTISANFLQQLRLDFIQIWEMIAHFIQQMLQDIKDFYKKGIACKQFKNISPHLMTKMDELFVFQIIGDAAFFEQTNMTLEQVAKEYLRLKLDGFRL